MRSKAVAMSFTLIKVAVADISLHHQVSITPQDPSDISIRFKKNSSSAAKENCLGNSFSGNGVRYFEETSWIFGVKGESAEV